MNFIFDLYMKKLIAPIVRSVFKIAIALALTGQLKQVTLWMMGKAAKAQAHGQFRLSVLNRALMPPHKIKR